MYYRRATTQLTFDLIIKQNFNLTTLILIYSIYLTTKKFQLNSLLSLASVGKLSNVDE